MKKSKSFFIPIFITIFAIFATNVLAETFDESCNAMPTMPQCTGNFGGGAGGGGGGGSIPTPPELPTPEVLLIGRNEIDMFAGDKYSEPGYSATLNGSDFTKRVAVTGVPEGTILNDFTVTYKATGEGEKSDTKTRLVHVNKRNINITFEDLSNMKIGDKDQELVYQVLNDKPNKPEIGVKIENESICERDDVEGFFITPLKEGTCKIDFTFEGNDYFKAYKETQSFEITSPKKKNIEIESELFDMTLSDFSQEIRYDSNAEVDFDIKSEDEDICQVITEEGFYVIPKSFGKCTIQFSFGGNNFYNELKSYEVSFNIVKNIEDMALNNGDMNNDGTPDSRQNNVLTIEGGDGDFHSVATDDKRAAIFDFRVDKKAVKTDGGVTVVNVCRNERDGKSEKLIPKCELVPVEVPAQTKIDTVIEFSMNGIKNGSTQNITLNIQLDGDNATIDPRKKVGDQLLQIDGVDIKYITLSGKRVAQLTFAVTDGGKYDEDSLANGQIIDPVFLVSAIPTTTTSTGGGVALPPLMPGYDAHIFDNKQVVSTKSSGIVLGASTSTVSTSTTASSTKFIFRKKLGYGSRNDDVMELQKVLLAMGYFSFEPGFEPIGIFGPRTKRALTAYQKDHKIFETGFFGTITMGELNK